MVPPFFSYYLISFRIVEETNSSENFGKVERWVVNNPADLKKISKQIWKKSRNKPSFTSKSSKAQKLVTLCTSGGRMRVANIK